MHYREIYKLGTGCSIEKGYEVHHIDKCRDNNRLTNLVALPREIHRKYHKLLHDYDMAIEMINNVQYLYKTEKQKYLKQINVFIDYKEVVYSHISNRDNLIANRDER